MKRELPGKIALSLVLLLVGACMPASAESLPAETGLPAQESVLPTTATATATAEAEPIVPTPSLLPATPTTATRSSPSPFPSSTPALAVECAQDVCVYSQALFLQRPILPPGRDTPDASYRFGSTQGETRDPHHGVEFLNSFGTPVLAAAAGKVVYAGEDKKSLVGPYGNFYGNVIVLEHEAPAGLRQEAPDIPQPIFTLYGHLSKLLVKEGDRVQAGQTIGQVGMSGIATGSHLHFEVRLGANDYAQSRNPELWLQPHKLEDGAPKGALAGRILDEYGDPMNVQGIVLQHLPGPGERRDYEVYVNTYEEKALVGLPPWEEGFGAGDLEPGWYRITFAQYGVQSREVQVFPGSLTLVTFRLSP